MPKSSSPKVLPKSPCVHGPTRRCGGRSPASRERSCIAAYWRSVSLIKQSYQPPMWKVGASTFSYLPSMLRYSQSSWCTPRPASLHKRDQFVRVRQLCEWQHVVAAACQEGVYGVDYLRELLPDELSVAGILAEEEVEGECRLRPELHQAELLYAAAHLDAVKVVAPGEAWDHALQRGRPHDGRVPLGLPKVREAVHADRPVGIGELRGPLDGIVAILVLLDERDELSFRTVTSAHVLHDDDVAGLRGRYRVKDRRARWEVLAVWEACQEDGIPTAAGRPVDVGHKGRAVAHFGRHVLLEQDLYHQARLRSRTSAAQASSVRVTGTAIEMAFTPRSLRRICAVSLVRGNVSSGSSTPRNSHRGPQPDFTS